MLKDNKYKLKYSEHKLKYNKPEHKTSDPNWWDEFLIRFTTMTRPTVRWKKLDPEAQIPEYKTKFAAGMDVRSNEKLILKAAQRAIVGTGLAMAIPVGYEAQVRSRSGLAANNGVVVGNAPGTIDVDYRGELKVILLNLSDKDFEIEKGDRIAQIVIAQCEHVKNLEVEELDDTKRGQGGFGSTGLK